MLARFPAHTFTTALIILLPAFAAGGPPRSGFSTAGSFRPSSLSGPFAVNRGFGATRFNHGSAWRGNWRGGGNSWGHDGNFGHRGGGFSTNVVYFNNGFGYPGFGFNSGYPAYYRFPYSPHFFPPVYSFVYYNPPVYYDRYYGYQFAAPRACYPDYSSYAYPAAFSRPRYYGHYPRAYYHYRR